MFGIPAMLLNTDECLGAAGMCCEANMSRSCDTSVLAWRVSRESYIRVRGCEPVLLHGLLFRGLRLQLRFWHFAWTFNQTTQSARCRPPALIRRPVPRTSTYIQDSVSLRCFKKTFCWVNFVVIFNKRWYVRCCLRLSPTDPCSVTDMRMVDRVNLLWIYFITTTCAMKS